MTALGVLGILHAHGLRVPADISVVGFDDLFIASYTDPPLTTVRNREGEWECWRWRAFCS